MASSHESIEANIGGNVSGQVAIGNYILQVGDISGGVVNIAPPAAKTSFDRRARPVDLRPRAFPSLLDRVPEIDAVKTALNSSVPVTLFSESGMGKTSLLRQIAHLPETKKFPDGVAYLMARSTEMNDLLQSIFDTFYASSDGQKPTDGKLRADLKELQALVILDDLTLNREDVLFLLDVMPNSTFILASTERSLWGEGQAIDLDGLPEEYALQLFERELGRLLTTDEKPVAAQICKILLFHPLRILQTASMIREDGLTIPEAFAKLTGTRTQSPTLELTLQKSSETQKKIFSLLAVAGGFALSRQHLMALVASVNFDAEIKSLLRRGFVEAQGTSFSLSGEAVSSLTKMWNLSSWEDALLNHFSGWLKTNPQDVLVDQAADTLFHLIKRAGEKKQWPQVVTLGRSLERIYILRKKWQGWLKILELLRMAARSLVDRKLEGWVLHQLGSRSLSLGAKVEAQEFFKQAMSIRHAIGDQAGMAVTQHNLNIAMNLPVSSKPAKTMSSGNGSLSRWLVIGALGGGAGIIILLMMVGVYYVLTPTVATTDTPTPTAASTDVPTLLPPTITSTPFPTATIRPTITLTFTPTLVPQPVVLFDFIFNADKARWEIVSDLGTFDELVTPVAFYEKIQTPSPEYFIDNLEEPYIGWQNDPKLEDGSREDLVVLSYPDRANSILRGYYDLTTLPLLAGDELVLKVGHKFPDSEFPFDDDGLVFQVFFLETGSEFAIPLFDIKDFYDGTTYETTIPIPQTLYGRSGQFIFEVYSGAELRFDWAVWMDAALVGLPR